MIMFSRRTAWSGFLLVIAVGISACSPTITRTETTGSGSNGGSGGTVFVVGQNRKMSESYSIILGPGGNWPNNQLRWDNGSQILFVGTSNSLPVTTANIGNTRVFHLISASYNGAQLNVYRDGGFVSNHLFTTSGPWTLSQVGAWFSTYFMEGDLAEVIVYETALSDNDRMLAETYLLGKYALP